MKGNDPYHLQLDDSSGHPGIVSSGILANFILVEPLNKEYGVCIEPLNDQEILKNAGIY